MLYNAMLPIWQTAVIVLETVLVFWARNVHIDWI